MGDGEERGGFSPGEDEGLSLVLLLETGVSRFYFHSRGGGGWGHGGFGGT